MKIRWQLLIVLIAIGCARQSSFYVTNDVEFNSERWKLAKLGSDGVRAAMVVSLSRQYLRGTISRKATIKLLGKPDQEFSYDPYTETEHTNQRRLHIGQAKDYLLYVTAEDSRRETAITVSLELAFDRQGTLIWYAEVAT